jgi:CRISPR-associated endonuclease Cas1
VTEHVDWLVVPGAGAHIRSKTDRLLVSQGGRVTEYDLEVLTHLLLAGRHTIQTATVSRLVRNGVRITFLEPDGEPVGVVRPYGDADDERLRHLQETVPVRAVAMTLVTHAAHARLGLIGETGAELYAGELELIQSLLAELPNLIRLQEMRRVHRMVGDMFYEIMARLVPPEIGLRRRTERPHRDPGNALLSLSHGILSSGVLGACLGARLDPSIGILSSGDRALVRDLSECFMTEMVDRTVFSLLRDGLDSRDSYQNANRCYLSEDLVHRVTGLLRSSIDRSRIDRQVQRYILSLEGKQEFVVV